MVVVTSPFIDVEARAFELRCNLPEGIAILPRNFASAKMREELVHEDSTVTIRTLWRTSGVSETKLEQSGEVYPYIHENAADWVGPLLFIGAGILNNSPELPQRAIGIILDYVKGQLGLNVENREVKFSIVREMRNEKEKTKKYMEFTYEGDVDHVHEILSALEDR